MSELIFISYSLFTIAIVLSIAILYKKGGEIVITLDELKGKVVELKKDVNRIVAILDSGKDAQAKIDEISSIVDEMNVIVEAAAPEPPPA